MTAGDVVTVSAPTASPVRHFGAGVLAGLSALLLAWILLIPPFGGTDEFDHAYRAAAVARGQWFATPSDATRGTGAWLEVPRDIVDAARPECQVRSYTTAADCVGTAHGDTVRIASGAGRYQPVFYAVVGAVALPFRGDTALYVMRLVTAAMCLGLVALALVATGTWGRSKVVRLTPVVACTPVLVYSCSIVSPNGVEMVAALAFWCSAVGLLVCDESHIRRLTVTATLSGVTLCALRPLGPLWCLLAAVVVLGTVRGATGRVRDLLFRRDVQVGALLVAIAAAQSVAWTVGMRALEVGAGNGQHTSLLHRLLVVLQFVPLWVLQSIAAFPMRDNATSPAVYACYLLAFGIVMTVAFRAAGRRVRIGLAVVSLGSLGFAYATTVTSYDSFGAAWQGRYGLPLTMGLVVLAGYALDRAGLMLPAPWAGVAGLSYVLAQVVSVSHTLGYEVGHSPLAHSSSWPRPPLVALLALALVGAVVLWWGQDLVDRRRGVSRA